MQIAILGAGNVASALAAGWVKAGHQVSIAVRDPQSPKAQKAQAALPTVPMTDFAQAFAQAEVLVLATPPEAVMDLQPYFVKAQDKIVIDTTNAIAKRPEPYPTAYHFLRQACGLVQVVKCFNTTGFENMQNPIYQGQGIDMFCAGDDPKAKAVAQELSKDLGFGACWDFGKDDRVQLLEQWALCWINFAIFQGHGRQFAFKVVQR